ncbi:MAG TPA: hypothetical protein VEJ20_07200 [Candidatus Eremiobacteraceae bacterium]|nr:hypothetical protein [Candidatus Eremiobacteraceae bacterium]
MTLAAWSDVAQIGVFIVITVTAVAALIQVRHLRTANQGAWLQAWMRDYEGPEYREAFRFVRDELSQRLEDPAFREDLRVGRAERSKHPEIVIANLFELWGMYFRLGAVDQRMFLAENHSVITAFWERLEPVVVLIAYRSAGNNDGFHSFEYLTVRAREWAASHHGGDYPKGASRIPLVDRWRTIDNVPEAAPSARERE